MSKKSYQMTLGEYQQIVVPHIAAYFKFLRKYKQFIKADYYGLEYLSWDEYVTREKVNNEESNLRRSKSEKSWEKTPVKFDIQYVKDRWLQKTGSTPEEASKEIDEKKNELFNNVKQYLTDADVQKFEDDEKKNNKRTVKRSADSGLFVQDLMDGVLTPVQVQEIFDSVGVKVPRHVQEMKDKVEYQGYSRSTHNRMLSSSKEFETKLRKELLPYMTILEDRYKGSIEKLVNDFIEYATTATDVRFVISKYCERKATSRKDYEEKRTTLQRYTENGKKVDLYEERLSESAKNYAENFIAEFLFKIQDKLKVITSKKGIPTFEIYSLKFSQGRAEGNFFIHYPDATTLRLETEIIFAGGYNIQRLHDRYLFKVFKDGKLVKLEDIDKAFESITESVKLKRYDNL